MKKVILATVAMLGILLASAALYLTLDLRQFEITELTPDLHMISSEWGGNVAVLKTGAGAVVVDTMTLKMQGQVIRELAEELTGEQVTLVINSHYHLDHSHGNPAFQGDIRFVATERTLHHLRQLDADYFSGKAANTLPDQTFSIEDQLQVGDKTIRVIHPGRGHTDGDLVVLFVEDQVLHTGDLFFNKLYPNIDLEAGGSVIAWVETLDALYELSFTQVIPGHGPVSDAAGIRQFQDFMRELAELGAYAASIGGDLQDTLVNGRLSADAGYQPISFGPLLKLDREFVIRRSWEEATGNFSLYEGYEQ
ncbi:MAG: MBL fold metallo-hydrolase [Halieaceae bacterium]